MIWFRTSFNLESSLKFSPLVAEPQITKTAANYTFSGPNQVLIMLQEPLGLVTNMKRERQDSLKTPLIKAHLQFDSLEKVNPGGRLRIWPQYKLQTAEALL